MKDEEKVVSMSSTEEKKAVKKENAKKAAKADKTKRGSKIFKFFRELKAEWKKIVWPSRKQVANNTLVVLTAMMVTGLFIWGIDSLFKVVFDLVLKR